MRLAVVGGGIAGLAAAWQARHDAQVTVFEPGRLGGRIQTEPFRGRPVDCGPDAFLTRTPDATRLCAEIGIDDLIAPSAGSTLVWWRGALRRLPADLVLGVPRRVTPLLTSGLIGPIGLVRAAADLVLPRSRLPEDVSVWDLVAARFGAQVAERLVDPLVGSIHAGSTRNLSAVTTTPQLVAAAKRSRSMVMGLRSLGGAAKQPAPFLAPRDGMGSIVATLTAHLGRDGVEVSQSRVQSLTAEAGGWRLEPDGRVFDGVVLATNASAAAQILGEEAPVELRELVSASVVIATLDLQAMDLPSGVNGILVPRASGWLMTACSFGSAKWPHWANEGRTVLRVSAGSIDDHRALSLTDDDLVDRLAHELGKALNSSCQPDFWRVNRWPDALPQFRVGHQQRVSRITNQLRRTHPGVAVCGASYFGAGIPACIASGRSASQSLLSDVQELQ